jgi:hypothetical protein
MITNTLFVFTKICGVRIFKIKSKFLRHIFNSLQFQLSWMLVFKSVDCSDCDLTLEMLSFMFLVDQV